MSKIEPDTLFQYLNLDIRCQEAIISLMPLTDRSVRKSGKVRKAEILEAATRLFCEYGFDRVTMQEVADEVGISKAAIYLYYDTKGDLFLAMLEHALDKIVTDLETKLVAEYQINRLLDVVFTSFASYAPLTSALRRLWETGGPPDIPPPKMSRFTSRVQSRFEEIVDLLGEVFSRAQRRGQIRKELDPQELARVLFRLSTVVTRFGPDIRKTVEEVFLKGVLTQESRV